MFIRALTISIILLCSTSIFAQKSKTLLAIFPHPDDESAIGEVLRKYAGLGYKVQVITATNGSNGTRLTKITAGEELGNLRMAESRCAAKKIGIEEPIFLGIERLDTLIGVGKYFAEHKKLMSLLKEKIPAIDPDFIITFGPDGDTSHSEHIVTGAAVTELLLREGWVKRYPLYYLSWTKEIGNKFNLGWVDNQYFNVKIDYSQDDENKALEMMPCYVTQFTPEEIAEDNKDKVADRSNTSYFRRFTVARGLRSKF